MVASVSRQQYRGTSPAPVSLLLRVICPVEVQQQLHISLTSLVWYPNLGPKWYSGQGKRPPTRQDSGAIFPSSDKQALGGGGRRTTITKQKPQQSINQNPPGQENTISGLKGDLTFIALGQAVHLTKVHPRKAGLPPALLQIGGTISPLRRCCTFPPLP